MSEAAPISVASGVALPLPGEKPTDNSQMHNRVGFVVNQLVKPAELLVID